MVHPSPLTTTVHNPQLRFLNALRNNEKPIMTFLGLPSLRMAQIVASTGVDVGFQQYFPIEFNYSITLISSFLNSLFLCYNQYYS